MFTLQYFDKNKLLKQFEYSTIEEAENALDENDIYNYSTGYKIVNNNTGDIEDEGGCEDIESTMDMMFPDEESYEGFDVDDFFDNN